MALDLANYDVLAHDAVKQFWRSRAAATNKQRSKGAPDAGTRGAVTAGKNMAGFEELVCKVVRANGPPDLRLFAGSKTYLPGFFRAAKNWDVLVFRGPRLIAAIEAKSQVGSFGNNQNNRIEEVIGSGKDFWTAHREAAFGKDAPIPFLGWLMLVEDCDATQKPVKPTENHFASYPEFKTASYVERYQILCRKLVDEQLYSAACLLHSSASAIQDGSYSDANDVSGLRNFVAKLAAHIAADTLAFPPSTKDSDLFGEF